MASSVLRDSKEGSKPELTKALYNEIQTQSGTNFTMIFGAVRMHIDNDDFFESNEISFET
jgi:hypothetical protein